MIRTRTIIQLCILAICCACIVAGIVLCIIDLIKGGIALLIVGSFVAILVFCDRRYTPPDTSGQIAVVVHEQPRNPK
jgi:membrane protein implicated in regulation of membrane protease activity